ncbi:MAG: DNA methyltransferase [Rickettsiales bacterium]|nr:DNA methyltransferase [Rickettsiales bacterium]
MLNSIQNFLENYQLASPLQSDLFGRNITPKKHFLTTNSSQTILNFENEFWTSKQRKSSSLHEISYRACFKAELPSFFIKMLTKENDVIYDPFAGRGTTPIEAALQKRHIVSNDINPLSQIFTEARLEIPTIENLSTRLKEIKISKKFSDQTDLSMFFEKETLNEILSLKNYLQKKRLSQSEDAIDKWIRMIATNRLTGHSTGFFSVYTLPPNQAISAKKQLELNQKNNRQPTYRDTKSIILKKTLSLIRSVSSEQKLNLKNAKNSAIFLNKSANSTPEILDNSVNLIVTSPPFLDVIDYAADNWLRCWFNEINFEEMQRNISSHKKIEDWNKFISACFVEFQRITKPQGYVAFEVGEVKNGKIKLEEEVLPIGLNAGFKCVAIIINSQNFTKTSNIWGVENNKKGTNSNRIVLFQKA